MRILISATLIVVLFSSFFFSGTRENKPQNSYEIVSNQYACQTTDFSGAFDLSEKMAYFEGSDILIPELLADQGSSNVLGLASEERWIEVDLSDQKLYAWEGPSLFLETPISSGLPWWPTPTGEFRIWIKLRATKMEGGQGRYYYYLPNVPYVMFFENNNVPGWKGYGIHGTYWHDDFGTPRSHGCVNVPTEIAKELYYWTTPSLAEGTSVVRSSSENMGTRIVIHE